MALPLPSLLLAPADPTGALEPALAARPAALVIDLGDERGAARAIARRAAVDLLAAARSGAPPCLVVRIAPLSTGLVDDDLQAILAGKPDAVLAPCTVGRRDVEHLGAKLAVAEALREVAHGTTGIVAVAGDTARGILALPSLAAAVPRLRALAFDGAAFGGPGSAPAAVARGALVLAAQAAGLPAIDLGGEALDDLGSACARARRDGFSGRLARHPGEVAAIEACFAGGRPPCGC